MYANLLVDNQTPHEERLYFLLLYMLLRRPAGNNRFEVNRREVV